MRVLFHRPDVTEAEARAAYDVVMGGWLTSGPVTARLEDMAKELTKSRHCVGVNSAATGLMLALRYRVERYSFPASCAALGGHFAANAGQWAMRGQSFDARDCDESLSTRGRYLTVGLEYGGHVIPHGDGALVDAAYGLSPIGSAWCKVVSLQATKSLTTGEGGILETNDDDFAAWLKEARSHGMQASSYERGEGDYEIVVPGGGFLLCDPLAAIAVSQLSRARQMRERRREIARAYGDCLREAIAAGRVIPVPRDYEKDSLGLYAMRIPHSENPGLDPRTWRSPRDNFRGMLAMRGVSTRSHYAAVWTHPAYAFLREQGERDCPLAARASKEIVTLPLFSAMTDEECAAVCAALKDTLGG